MFDSQEISKMQARVSAHLAEKYELAKSVWGHKLENYKLPTVRYAKKGTTAGTANIRGNVINLNLVLLMENGQVFIDRTVTHELAHLIDGYLHPENYMRIRGRKSSPHGPDWKRVMRLLGAEPSRCHSYDTTNAKVQKSPRAKYVWKCTDPRCGVDMDLGAIRHAKQLKATPGYGFYMGSKGCKVSHPKQFVGVRLTPNGIIVPLTQQHVNSYAPIPSTSGTTRRYATVRQDHTNIPLSGLSKRERTELIVNRMAAHGNTRGQIIDMLMSELDMSKAGAGTYYYNAKKALGL